MRQLSFSAFLIAFSFLPASMQADGSDTKSAIVGYVEGIKSLVIDSNGQALPYFKIALDTQSFSGELDRFMSTRRCHVLLYGSNSKNRCVFDLRGWITPLYEINYSILTLNPGQWYLLSMDAAVDLDTEGLAALRIRDLSLQVSADGAHYGLENELKPVMRSKHSPTGGLAFEGRNLHVVSQN
ncbi:MAG: hypothetical protein AAF092_17170 [Pseudomonadota bacterium]